MRWWSAVPWPAFVLAAVLGAGPALAQGNPADLRVDETKNRGQVFQSLKDFSSYGVALGGMRVFGGPLGSKAQVKPMLQGVFRYRFSDDWVGVGEFGFGWNSFKDKADTVLTFTMGTLGVARRFTEFGGNDVRLGLGLGVYRWNYKWHGKTIQDNQTWRDQRGMAPGGYLGVEGERRLSRHMTFILSAQQHFVFLSDSKKFVSLFDRNYPFLGFRIGVNYHFSPAEGILWERKTSRKIRLESGKEGK
jgi:hypothetical protein